MYPRGRRKPMRHSIGLYAAILGTMLPGGIVSVAASGQQWLLMARHGECMEIARLRRKVPELGDVDDPYSFVKLMQKKGHTVTSTEMMKTKGKAVEVKVPERELSLVFVTPELCQKSGAK